MKDRLPPLLAYLARVVLGILILAAMMMAAHALRLSGWSELAQEAVLGGLILGAVAILPIARRVYDRMDELQKILHQQACVASLPLLAAASGVVGILQAVGLLPPLNQFWTLGAIVASWGLHLMLADRRYK